MFERQKVYLHQAERGVLADQMIDASQWTWGDSTNSWLVLGNRYHIDQDRLNPLATQVGTVVNCLSIPNREDCFLPLPMCINWIHVCINVLYLSGILKTNTIAKKVDFGKTNPTKKVINWTFSASVWGLLWELEVNIPPLDGPRGCNGLSWVFP